MTGAANAAPQAFSPTIVSGETESARQSVRLDAKYDEELAFSPIARSYRGDKGDQDKLGARFDICGFHDRVPGSGQMPLNLLDRRVNEWIAGMQAG